MRLWMGALLLGLLCQAGPERADLAPGQYMVSAGDTLTRLAQRFGITVDALRQANPNVDEQHLGIGAVLNIPHGAVPSPQNSVAAAPQSAVAPPPPNAVIGHGDTLYSVAHQYGVSVDALRSTNHLADDRLEVGQSLSIPTGQNPPAPLSLPIASPVGANWLSVRLADGTTAWAPRDSLLLPATSPLNGPQIVAMARRLAGVPYVWGGTTPNGVDCSGFVQTIYSLAGYSLPRTADVQFDATREVTREDLLPGDLVFFTTYLPGPSHVGIYVGDGHFIHASSSRGVSESALTDPYYASRFLGGHRLPQWLPPVATTAPAPTPAAATMSRP